MNLTDPWQRLLQPLFELYPPDRAMEQLVVSAGPSDEVIEAVEAVLDEHSAMAVGTLEAALWLYVDDLDRSHSVSQGIENSTGSYWHGIMHRREGDFLNSHYWFNKVGEHHPVLAMIDDYDPHSFIDEVERRHGTQSQELVTMQRREWQTLFEWCAREAEARQ